MIFPSSEDFGCTSNEHCDDVYMAIEVKCCFVRKQYFFRKTRIFWYSIISLSSSMNSYTNRTLFSWRLIVPDMYRLNKKHILRDNGTGDMPFEINDNDHKLVTV